MPFERGPSFYKAAGDFHMEQGPGDCDFDEEVSLGFQERGISAEVSKEKRCPLFRKPDGLAMANIYLLLSVPAFYLFYLPYLKVHELRSKDRTAALKLDFLLDFRMLVIPAVIAAIILNLADVKYPAFITRFYIIDALVCIASSLSFFAIGLRVKLSRLKNYINLYFLIAAIKFILTPALALVIIALLALVGQNLNSTVQKVIIILSATPSAVLMVTMSNVFDLDGPLASALWVVTMAIFVAVVVPVLFFLFA